MKVKQVYDISKLDGDEAKIVEILDLIARHFGHIEGIVSEDKKQLIVIFNVKEVPTSPEHRVQYAHF